MISSPTSSTPYRGRFAPSPTGALHFGSLVAAVGSYLDARTRQGEWLVRMEDVDAPRNQPGAAEHILRTLEAFGFAWDGPILWQSQRLDAYAAVLEQLKSAGQVYPCACSRKEIAEAASLPAVDGGMVYPGTCRAGLPVGRQPRAWRLRVGNAELSFEDRLQGRVTQVLAHDVGDFVLFRADGQYAYQLAVVVDDAMQGITDVVRGADLMDSTVRQCWLQHCLGYSRPRYAHLPVATNAAGEKLSKQTLAQPLDPGRAAMQLSAALQFLGQRIPDDMAEWPLAEVWKWALSHWQWENIPRARGIAYGENGG